MNEVWREENLEELFFATSLMASSFSLRTAITQVLGYPRVLDQVLLDSGERQNVNGPCLQMMTLHSAKGLEFPLVFLGGLEEVCSSSNGSDGRAVWKDGVCMWVYWL